MTIYKEIYDLIADTSQGACDHEIGAVLGADRADDICEVVFDRIEDINRYMYTPNVEYLNEVIERWQRWRFAGIVHSHLNNQCTLSSADKAYIEYIMMAMPPDIDHLYFPVYVISENKLYGYKAERMLNRVIIFDEPINII